ncbi:MAG: peptidoglycan-binding domain-containing protein [Pseudomonadota bacterium]
MAVAGSIGADQVAALQRLLRAMGLYRGACDGTAGPATDRAVRAALALLPAVPPSVQRWPAAARRRCLIRLLARPSEGPGDGPSHGPSHGLSDGPGDGLSDRTGASL